MGNAGSRLTAKIERVALLAQIRPQQAQGTRRSPTQFISPFFIPSARLDKYIKLREMQCKFQVDFIEIFKLGMWCEQRCRRAAFFCRFRGWNVIWERADERGPRQNRTYGNVAFPVYLSTTYLNQSCFQQTIFIAANTSPNPPWARTMRAFSRIQCS